MFPIIQLSQGLYIPTYFLVISIAFSVSIVWVSKRSQASGYNTKEAMDICLVGMITSFIGARLFHVFYELPALYLESPKQIFYFWQGGFVFYGGLIGGFASIWFYSRYKNIQLLKWLNVFAIPMALAYVIGRFATLLSGSGFGRPTTMPWGIQYPLGSEAPAGVSLHPTPIYAMIWEFLVLILLMKMEKRSEVRTGVLFLVLMIGHGLGRIIMEQFRDDFRGARLLSLSISSWMSLLMIALALWAWRKNGFKVYKA